MMNLKNAAIALTLCTTGLTAYAGDLDVTQKYIDYLSTHFVGSQSSSERVWDNTYCVARNPITGSCTQKGGSKVYGQASGSVLPLESNSGNGWLIRDNSNPWTGAYVVEHWTDLKVVFPYSGYSEGKKQCFPGDFHCGMEWDSLHPTGRIIAKFTAAGEKFRIEMTYEVQAGHGDKPNGILRDAMLTLEPKLKSVTENFIKSIGSGATIEISHQ